MFRNEAFMTARFNKSPDSVEDRFTFFGARQRLKHPRGIAKDTFAGKLRKSALRHGQ